MVASLRSRLTPGQTRLLPAVGALAAGAAVALAAVLVPAAWLEDVVGGSGLPALLPVAEPPLGLTARAVLALGGGVLVGAIAWAALYLLFGPGGPLAAPRVRGTAPSVRRADAHPDAPPRWPLSAAELASPSAPPALEKTLPADLDVPLAQFDPTAVLPVPREPVRPVKPLAALPKQPLQPGERLQTFKLAPPPPPAPVTTDEPPSIEALLRRLEQGAQRRAARAG